MSGRPARDVVSAVVRRALDITPVPVALWAAWRGAVVAVRIAHVRACLMVARVVAGAGLRRAVCWAMNTLNGVRGWLRATLRR